MPLRDPNDYKYWRDQAAELRAKAATYENEFAAQAARRIADKYDQMADHAEECIIHGIGVPTPGEVRKERRS
jgi:predicted NBD/HSP70 family sugar kinase